MDKICRTCLKTQSTLQPLFEDNKILLRIQIISSIEMTNDEHEFPTNICNECVESINKFHDFRLLIIKNETKLQNRYFKTKQQHDADGEHLWDEDIDNDVNVQETIPIPYVKCESDQIFVVDDECTPTDYVQIQITESVRKKKRRKSYHCQICDLTFEQYSKWKNHRQNGHMKSGVCNICGKSIRADNLARHIKMHSALPETCSVCGKMFKNSESLRCHRLYHNNEEIVCEVCGNSYSCRRQYHMHLRRHSAGEKKTDCTVCGKTVGVSSMKKHMRAHTGERPYICEFCKKGFSSSNALKTHRRRHTNERPYVCEHCPMKFAQKVSLRTHLSSKHSSKEKD